MSAPALFYLPQHSQQVAQRSTACDSTVPAIATNKPGRRPARCGPYITKLNVPANSFAARLRILRTRLGLTQAELGAMVGASQLAITQYERGKREPSAGSFMALAAALGTTAEHLWHGGEPPVLRGGM